MLFRFDLFKNLFLDKCVACLFVLHCSFLKYVVVFEEELPVFS